MLEEAKQQEESEPTGLTDAGPRPMRLRSFGNYVLVAKLGQGGMAQVYLSAMDGMGGFRKLNVLKVLHSHLENEPQFVEMFMDEARLAARLSHPFVVNTFEVGEHQGAHYIAMEYLDGQPLDRVLRRISERGERLAVDATMSVLLQSLEGLHYAHELQDYDGSPLNVVHRDVSPHNLFLTYQGTSKLLDFGIAKAATQVVATRTGVIKGKYAYMAPEQAEGRDVDARADVWSMGVVAWEALTGERLFRGPNDMATLNAVMKREVPLVSELVEGVPKAVAEVVNGALVRDPSARFRSAQEFRSELEATLSASGLRARSQAVGKLMTELFEAEMAESQELVQRVMNTDLSEKPPPLQLQTGVAQADEETPITATSFQLQKAAQQSQGHQDNRSLLLVAWLALGISLLVVGVLGYTQFIAPRPGASTGSSTGPAAPPDPLRDPTPVSVAETQPDAAVAAVDPAQVETPADAGTVAQGDPEPVRETRAERLRRLREQKRLLERNQTSMRPTMEPEVVVGTGTLSFDTVPWTTVSVGGRRLGQTPLLGVELPAGTHRLTLENPELGIRQTTTVSIRAGETTRRRIAIQ